MKPKTVSLSELVQRAKRHRLEGGDDKTAATKEEMNALLLADGIRIVHHFRQVGGNFRLDVIYQGEHFVCASKNRFEIPLT